MTKTCANSWCRAPFEVRDEDMAFYEKVSPVFGGEKFPVPPPTQCPECRSAERMVWRNERSLYGGSCAMCKRSIVSMYKPNPEHKILCEDCWRSDSFDATSHGRPHDLTQPFFKQFAALLADVPHRGLFITGISENSDYINWAGPCKNCYLVFNSGLLEDCYFSKGLLSSKSCMDMLTCQQCEYCYDCINVSQSYNLQSSQNCTQCHDSAFLFNCIGCSNCIGCTNMNHASHCILNEQYTPETFERAKKDIFTAGSMSGMNAMRARFTEAVLKAIHRERQSVNAENSTGDFLFNTKNCHLCFEATNAEDCAYLDCSKRCTSSQDLYGYGYDSELLYECVGVGYSFNVAFSVQCERASDSLFCFQCNDVKHCFGCVGLRKAQYCVFNKQYAKEEYETIVSTILKKMQSESTWGSFFSAVMSPFGYNETVAQEYFPRTKEEIVQRGWKWNDYEPPLPKVTKTIKAADLPDALNNIPDDILNWAVECEVTNKPFKIIKQELDFYRKMNIPVPRFHPDERHKRRMALRNPRKLWNRECAKCSKPIATSYSPNRPETVVCEECYLKEVY